MVIACLNVSVPVWRRHLAGKFMVKQQWQPKAIVRALVQHAKFFAALRRGASSCCMLQCAAWSGTLVAII